MIPIFQEEFTFFLSARDPSSAALAQQALNAVWDVLIQLPVYRHLEQRSGSVRSLLREMKESPELVDEMLTPGTGRSEMLHEWMGRLTKLPGSIWEFILSAEKMLCASPNGEAQSIFRGYPLQCARTKDAISSMQSSVWG